MNIERMPENGQVTAILQQEVKYVCKASLLWTKGNTRQESLKASSLKNGPTRRLNKLAATVLYMSYTKNPLFQNCK